jgi:hypothetical protein
MMKGRVEGWSGEGWGGGVRGGERKWEGRKDESLRRDGWRGTMEGAEERRRRTEGGKKMDEGGR